MNNRHVYKILSFVIFNLLMINIYSEVCNNSSSYYTFTVDGLYTGVELEITGGSGDHSHELILNTAIGDGDAYTYEVNWGPNATGRYKLEFKIKFLGITYSTRTKHEDVIGKVKTIALDISNQNYIAKASESIFLEQGFKYVSSSTNSFGAIIVSCPSGSQTKSSFSVPLKIQNKNNENQLQLEKNECVENDNINVYPNPTSSFLTIEIPEIIINNSSELFIYNSQGQLIDKLIANQSTLEYEFRSKGIYFITSFVDKKKFYSKIIVN